MSIEQKKERRTALKTELHILNNKAYMLTTEVNSTRQKIRDLGTELYELEKDITISQKALSDSKAQAKAATYASLFQAEVKAGTRLKLARTKPGQGLRRFVGWEGPDMVCRILLFRRSFDPVARQWTTTLDEGDFVTHLPTAFEFVELNGFWCACARLITGDYTTVSPDPFVIFGNQDPRTPEEVQ